jgi:hypothetical protein
MRLERRLRRLESGRPPEPPATVSPPPIDAAAFFRRLEEKREEEVRRAGLPLEEQLALARADAGQQMQDARPSSLSEQLHGLGERIRRVAERVQAAHIRGLEIDLLMRDQRIDAATASRLREDAESHMRTTAALMPLPFPV